MANYNVFDFAIIGGGISSCVFVYSYIKNGFNGRIVIIGNGRQLGGRSSKRNSLNNKAGNLIMAFQILIFAIVVKINY
tara:strand:+ start:121 stop:354 length:234 start_codon:yes stop_codon:yes gene_type:complete